MNRLVHETSPYLRQHAGNPVDWYPWGDEAFERARSEDRPVFLSVGYSACHWCHVMAHESFENAETARVLNTSFVCVKVDREERPDVDAVYMDAVQSMTGSGGWPMSVFLTPDRRPFFGGTYFPPDDRHGLPSFLSVLVALDDAWKLRRAEVETQANELSKAISSRSVLVPGNQVTAALGTLGGTGDGPNLLDSAVEELAGRFDSEWGGFGPAPKFPQPTLVDIVLRHGVRHPGTDARGWETMATTTLDAMAAGGIHDHLGGGFSRYATDVEWSVPHFEKMLYDQAGLLRAYLHGWQVTRRADYLHVVEGIIGYVDRDLTTPEGGICSAEDADSEGVEGKFYVWTEQEVARAVGNGQRGPDGDTGSVIEAIKHWFAISRSGNFEGANILRRPIGAPLLGPRTVEIGRRLLVEARKDRKRPGLDDKILTEWNAMYASALAEAASATGNPDWGLAAVSVGTFLCRNLRRTSDGRWLRSWQRQGGARHLAYAADYAWLVDCFTRLAELTGQAGWTTLAIEAADDLLALFHDDAGGGFFTTGNDAEALIVRTKDFLDGATPSANGVAAVALVRLGGLTGITRYTVAAREIVELLGEMLVRHPTALAHTVVAADMLRGGLTEVVVTGDRPDLLDVVRSRWIPDGVVAWGEPTDSPLWHGREPGLAYVCRNYACALPASDPASLSTQLHRKAL
ncbi:MAG: thioredoxin domain-containing protein [Acidimicrobiales bacterium]